MSGFVCTTSFVVVLGDILDVRGGVFVLSIVTLEGDALSTLCGVSLVRMLVNFCIASEWRILSLVVVGMVFWSAFSRWSAVTSALSASEMVCIVQ